MISDKGYIFHLNISTALSSLRQLQLAMCWMVTLLALHALIPLMITAQLCVTAMSKNSILSDHNGGVQYIQ